LPAAQGADVGLTGNADGIFGISVRRGGALAGTVPLGSVVSRASARWRPAAGARGLRRSVIVTPVLAGVTSRPWVNLLISVQGATCGAELGADGQRCGGQRLDEAGQLCSEGGPDLTVDPGDPPETLVAQPVKVVLIAERTDPAADGGGWAPELRGDLSVPDPVGVGLQRLCRSPWWCRLGVAASPM
jgi:hypothetical protein